MGEEPGFWISAVEQYSSGYLESWRVMQKFGPEAAQVIPFARRCLRNPHGVVNESKAVEVMQFLQVAGPKAVAALPDVEGALNFPRTYQDAQVPLKLMREEATKTAGILKGLAAATAEKIAVSR